MVRTILVLGVLGGISYGVVSWATGGPETDLKHPGNRPAADAADGPRGGGQQGAVGEKTFRDTLTTKPQATRIKDPAPLGDHLVIPDARINSTERQEVSSPRQGQILVLGTEIDSSKIAKEQLQRLTEQGKISRIETAFLATRATAADRARGVQVFQIKGEDGLWRRWSATENPEPHKLKLVLEPRIFLRLQKGTSVHAGQLLGFIDPRLAIAEAQIKIANLNASDAELRTSIATKNESRKRFDRQQHLLAKNAASPEEVGAAELTWVRYVEEEKAKFQAVNKARQELKQALVTMDLYELRAESSGVVKDIIKYKGEALSEREQVLLLQNPERLQVEGFVPVQYAKWLAKGMPVVIEPTQPEAPAGVLQVHREAVNAVAVSKGELPLVVSAGEDRRAMVWEVNPKKDRHTGRLRWEGKAICSLDHPSAVRSVACTPPTAKNNLCLTGTADGVGRLWDLAAVRAGGEPEPRELAESHRGPIFAAAFNADGTVCATGSEDRSICLWDTTTGKLLHRIEEAHKGAVTSLSFAPENKLISTGRDRYIVTWTLKEGETPKREKEIGPLNGLVDTLGVSSDGKQVLFDQGRQLRVLSLANNLTRGVIVNTSTKSNFTTFALFSPDGNAVLTAGSSNRSVQLWRNPATSKNSRATELRQYMWPEARTNCAAFAPQAPFAVTGTEDHQVVIWNLPGAEEYKEAQPNAVIKSIDPFLDTSQRQVRVIAEVEGKGTGLMPGGTATIVVYPK